MTYDDYPAQIWTTVEIGVAIIIACLPVCRVVIEHLLPVDFLPNSRRYLRTKDKNNDQLLKSVERPFTSRERQAQDVYGVLDDETLGMQLKVPEATAAPGTTDKIGDQRQEGSRPLRYTAEVNRANSDDAAAIHGQGRWFSDVEAGNSIAVKHDVVVTRQGC